MNNLIPYLVFPGTCKEAMAYYASVLDGEITMMQTFGESPVPVPEDSRNRIFNSELKASGIHFKASDDLPGHEVRTGTNISLFLMLPSEKTQEKVFNEFSEGGKVLFPIADGFGMVKDKYDIQWMLVNKEA